MRNIYKLLITISVLFVTSLTIAQTQDKKWGVETELIQPFVPNVGIYQFRLTKTIYQSEKQKGDILIGAYLRPNVTHDIVKEIDEYMLLLGYRHFFWKGLHVEGGIEAGYYWGRENLIDKKDYEGVGVFWQTLTGYKCSFKQQKYYILPQFGVLSAIMSDIGPRGGKLDTFIQGNLLIGIQF